MELSMSKIKQYLASFLSEEANNAALVTIDELEQRALPILPRGVEYNSIDFIKDDKDKTMMQVCLSVMVGQTKIHVIGDGYTLRLATHNTLTKIAYHPLYNKMEMEKQ